MDTTGRGGGATGNSGPAGVTGRTPRGRRADRGRPRKPSLPEGRAKLPGDVYRDLVAASSRGEQVDVVRAYGAAAQALAAEEVARAIELLAWAKAAAPRSAAVRELLGVACYRAGEFARAQRELLAYRRMSGRHDQNHLLADCARAAGRDDRVAEYVAEMEGHAAPPDRVAEGLIVLAGARADRGDVRGALGVLERADLRPARVQPWHPRLWYVAADLCARLGDVQQAREYLEAIAAVEEDFLDVPELLRALGA